MKEIRNKFSISSPPDRCQSGRSITLNAAILEMTFQIMMELLPDWRLSGGDVLLMRLIIKRLSKSQGTASFIQRIE
jgi:hypothetical protein